MSAVVAWRQSSLSDRQARTADALAHMQAETQRDLASLQSALATEQHEREALFDRSLRAADVLSMYREPLAAAAYDLQSRVYNILRMNFFGKWGNGHERADEAVKTTLFRLAQYFGWSEILRRKIQFLSFPEDEDTRRVAQLQFDIKQCFLSDRYGVVLMIWSDEQRAIGEKMIVEEHGDILCMGYARFRNVCGDLFGLDYERFGDELCDPGAQTRLRDAQHLLCELVETLDSRRLRYSQSLDRA